MMVVMIRKGLDMLVDFKSRYSNVWYVSIFTLISERLTRIVILLHYHVLQSYICQRLYIPDVSLYLKLHCALSLIRFR